MNDWSERVFNRAADDKPSSPPMKAVRRVERERVGCVHPLCKTLAVVRAVVRAVVFFHGKRAVHELCEIHYEALEELRRTDRDIHGVEVERI